MLEWLGGGVAGAAAVGLSLRYNWWRVPRQGVPLLMYHHITNELNGTGLGKLRVSPRRFARQLDWLIDHGYDVVTMSRALGPTRRPSRWCSPLTMGMRIFMKKPGLSSQERGLGATVFLVTSQLDGVNQWDQDKGEPRENLLYQSPGA
jgi:hypothetical protein